MIYSTINNALESHLKLLADSNGVDVAWPNIAFNPVGGVYYQPALIPVETKTPGLPINSSNDNAGIFQVNVNFTKETGTIDLRFATDELIVHFSRGTTISKDGLNVFIEQVWPSGQVQKAEAWFFVPVSIRYRVFS